MDNSSNPAGGVRSTSISITLNAKSLGVDAFVKVEETYEFNQLASDADAVIRRDDMAALLTEQALAIVERTATEVRGHVANVPRGHVSVHPVAPQPAPAGAMAGQPVQGTGAAAIVAVANGAQSGSDWRSTPSKFGDGDLRYLSTAAYSTAQLEATVQQWIASKGYNPAAFKVWDNRPGQRGLEAGVPNGAVAAVKVSQEFQASVPADFQRNAVARVKFNNDGSLYVWFTKEFEAAEKYGAVNALRANASVGSAASQGGEEYPF